MMSSWRVDREEKRNGFLGLLEKKEGNGLGFGRRETEMEGKLKKG